MTSRAEAGLKKRIRVLAGLFLLNAAVFALHILPQSNLNSMDGLYHVRYAQLYGARGLFTDFPWMQFSFAQEFWSDHHFLYHLLLIPFTWFGLILAQKLAGVVFGALALTACANYLLVNRVRHVWLWSLLLLMSSDYFLYRMMMPRALSLSLLFIMLMLPCIERHRHHLWLAVLAFLYAWSHQTALVAVPMALCAAVWGRFRTGKWHWRTVLFAAAGVLLGLTLNPFFPNTFRHLFFHIVPYFTGQAASGAVQGFERIGFEWTPLPIRHWLLSGSPALLMGVLVPILGWGARRRWPQDIGVLLVGTGALLSASGRFARFFEYFVPFAILLGARLIDRMLAGGPETDSAGPERGSAGERAPRSQGRGAGVKALPVWAKCALGVVALALVTFGVRYHVKLHRESFHIDPRTALESMEWLQENTPPRSIVFYTNWTSFPLFFYHNTHNYYLHGLNPMYFRSWDPQLYSSYRRIATGRARDPVTGIVKLFRSHHVILQHRRIDRALMRQLEGDRRAKRVHADSHYRIYRLELGSADPAANHPNTPE